MQYLIIAETDDGPVSWGVEAETEQAALQKAVESLDVAIQPEPATTADV